MLKPTENRRWRAAGGDGKNPAPSRGGVAPPRGLKRRISNRASWSVRWSVQKAGNVRDPSGTLTLHRRPKIISLNMSHFHAEPSVLHVVPGRLGRQPHVPDLPSRWTRRQGTGRLDGEPPSPNAFPAGIAGMNFGSTVKGRGSDVLTNMVIIRFLLTTMVMIRF